MVDKKIDKRYKDGHRKLTKEGKRALVGTIKKKLLSKIDSTYAIIGKKFDISQVMMQRYILIAKQEIEIERVKEEYEAELRKWKKQIATQGEKEDTVLHRLYINCIDGEDTNACVAWLRASGHFKAAEVRAKQIAGGGDELDWRKVIADMDIDEEEYEEG